MSARKRKQGETLRQENQRLLAELKNSKFNNDALRQALKGTLTSAVLKMLTQEKLGLITNKRSGKDFRDEAQFMFTSLALIEDQLRSDGQTESTSYMYVTGTLSQLGFTQPDQYEGKTLKDGVYLGES